MITRIEIWRNIQPIKAIQPTKAEYELHWWKNGEWQDDMHFPTLEAAANGFMQLVKACGKEQK